MIAIPIIDGKKKCTGCFESKSIDEFKIDKKSNKPVAECKICEAKRNKEWREKNKERLQEQREERKGIKSNQDKKYRKNNLEKCKTREKKYREENKEKVKKFKRAWREKNSDRIKKTVKEYMKSESGKEARKIADYKKRALKISTADGTITKQSLQELLIKQNNKCHHCKCKLDETKHLDHYMPLSRGGIHSIENVVWSCPGCNMRKHATIPKVPLKRIA